MCDILVVEDDDGIGQMVRDVLSDEGYAVEVAAEGQAALSYLQRCRHLPQLILLDLVMPGMDGVQFLELQQNDPRLAAVPVLLFSAASALEQIARTFGAAYFPKPFDVTTLLTIVDHYVPARQPDILMPASTPEILSGHNPVPPAAVPNIQLPVVVPVLPLDPIVQEAAATIPQQLAAPAPR